MIRSAYRVTLTMLLAMVASHAQESDLTADPESSRELIRQWVQTERIISEEKSAWQVEKQQMQELLGIYQQELKLLDEELNQAGTSAELIDENKEKLEASLRQYRDARQLLRATITRLLPRMRKLVTRFPQPLQEELTTEINVLDGSNALDEPRDVLKSIIAVLNTASRFNRTVTLVEETRAVSDEKKITVKVLYLGLCRAYFTSGSGETAGVGSPTSDGWTWAQRPEIADEVLRIMAVHQKSSQPQIISLPVQLQTGEARQ